MGNKLADETSPYLRQHADNPVDWFPWGEEAFAEARRRDVPIFLSVGYSSCHWCHVMARESFEDVQVAALLNERFVNVKVDREERPDVDAVYMQATQAMTGSGGWPMSVFMTPDGAPFFAGTYWPREEAHGLPSFPKVAGAVASAWADDRAEVVGSAARITAAIEDQRRDEVHDQLDVTVADTAAQIVLDSAWDREHGGFGRAPKFPQAMTIEWLVHHAVRTGEEESLDAAVQALDAMARGGIHDQIGGGFARYATDAAWLVPHFEKMLNDNALLLSAYATAASVTGREDFARVARTTAGFLLGELRTPDGTFVSAIDADSEGAEGRFYIWRYDELVGVLHDAGLDAVKWASFLGASLEGNWEGVNVLHEPVARAQFAAAHDLDEDAFAQEWEQVRAALLAHRATRVAPAVDDKVLTDWNALTIRGLVLAGMLLDEPGWITAGATAASALHNHQVIDGALHHSSRAGKVAVPGFLEDHATLALADLELFAATGEHLWFERALALATDAHARFHDAEAGGWFQTAHDAEALYTRPKDTWDNAVPAGTSVMVEVALKLAGLTGDNLWRQRAEEGMRSFQQDARVQAAGFGWMLRQFEALAAGPREVAIVGPSGAERDALAAVTHRVWPGVVVAVSDDEHDDRIALLTGRGAVDGAPAAYVCRNLACELPVTSPDALATLLVD